MFNTINLVREFHKAFLCALADSPTPGTKELRELRVKLIAEELLELCSALDVELSIDTFTDVFEVQGREDDHRVNLVAAADALGDLDYVVQGSNLAFGIPGPVIVAEIHRSNMSKLGEDGKPIHREDGKVVKGPNYTPPELGPLLMGDQALTDTTYQSMVYQWVVSTFGEEIAQDRRERSHRFMEEALELVQAAGISKKEVLMLVDYVFNRPTGELKQEVGGVMLTLAAFCEAHGVSSEEAGLVELMRCWAKQDKIRAKQATKPASSPLPGVGSPEENGHD